MQDLGAEYVRVERRQLWLTINSKFSSNYKRCQREKFDQLLSIIFIHFSFHKEINVFSDLILNSINATLIRFLQMAFGHKACLIALLSPQSS